MNHAERWITQALAPYCVILKIPFRLLSEEIREGYAEQEELTFYIGYTNMPLPNKGDRVCIPRHSTHKPNFDIDKIIDIDFFVYAIIHEYDSKQVYIKLAP